MSSLLMAILPGPGNPPTFTRRLMSWSLRIMLWRTSPPPQRWWPRGLLTQWRHPTPASWSSASDLGRPRSRSSSATSPAQQISKPNNQKLFIYTIQLFLIGFSTSQETFSLEKSYRSLLLRAGKDKQSGNHKPECQHDPDQKPDCEQEDRTHHDLQLPRLQLGDHCQGQGGPDL